jgi:hypothetical protein
MYPSHLAPCSDNPVQLTEDGTEIRYAERILCIHIGEPLGFTPCGRCSGSVRLKKFECKLHNAECVPAIKPATDTAIRWCQECPDNTPQPIAEPRHEKENPNG